MTLNGKRKLDPMVLSEEMKVDTRPARKCRYVFDILDRDHNVKEWASEKLIPHSQIKAFCHKDHSVIVHFKKKVNRSFFNKIVSGLAIKDFPTLLPKFSLLKLYPDADGWCHSINEHNIEAYKTVKKSLKLFDSPNTLKLPSTSINPPGECKEKKGFNDIFQNIMAQYEVMTIKSWKTVWEDFSAHSEITVENANIFLKSLTDKFSTRQKKKSIITILIRKYLKDETIRLNKITGYRAPKPKYKFTPEEIWEFLYFLRHLADLEIWRNHIKPRDSFFYNLFVLVCGLILYGVRLSELLKLEKQHIYPSNNEFKVIDIKAKITKTFPLLADYYIYLCELSEGKDDADYIFNSGTRNVTKTISELMKQCPKLKEIDFKKYALGSHCFRVARFQHFQDMALKFVQEETLKVSQHKSRYPFSYYLTEPVLAVLADRTSLGKCEITNNFRIGQEKLDKNFRLSVRYCRNQNKANALCTSCNLLVLDKCKTCNDCNDNFHTFCVKFNDGKCVKCLYQKEDGYRIYMSNEKVSLCCRICKDFGSSFCDGCLKIQRKRQQSKNKMLLDFLKLSIPTTSEAKSKICKETLAIALKEQNLMLYDSLKYHNCINDANDSLVLCKMNKNNMEVVSTTTLPPVTVIKHKILGFCVMATAKINSNTLICEYLGDIFIERDIRKPNDSQMTVVDAGTTERNLIISPKHGANLAKYISGHFNDNYCNVGSWNVEVDGKARVFLYSKTGINEQDILYYNYGGNMVMKDYIYIKKMLPNTDFEMLN